MQKARAWAQRLRWLAAALAGVLALSAGAFAQDQAETADLTILIRASNLSDALRQEIDNFAAARGITVNYVITGSWPDHFEQMLLLHLGGIPFDVTFVDQTYVPNAARGILADLTPFIERDRISLDEFVPLGVESFYWRGALYALPSYVSNLAMGYNSDIFASAGFAGIVTDWDSSEFTWDDFVDIGKKLTVDRNGDGSVDQWALRRVPPWRIAPFMFGGDWVDADGRLSLSTPELVRSIEAFAELALEHGIVNPSGSSSALAAGQVAMEPVGQYTIRQWDGYDWNYAVGVMPEGGARGTRSTILYADGFAIGSQSRNPQLAWEFIKTFVTDPEVGMAMPRHAASVPAYMPLHLKYLDEVSAEYPSVDWVRFSDGLFRGKVFQVRFSPYFDQIEAILNDATTQIFAGDKPTRTALAEIEPQVLDLWNRE